MEDKQPKRRITTCPHCGDEAVALMGDETNYVTWCINGHVTVTDTNVTKLVYTF